MSRSRAGDFHIRGWIGIAGPLFLTAGLIEVQVCVTVAKQLVTFLAQSGPLNVSQLGSDLLALTFA